MDEKPKPTRGRPRLPPGEGLEEKHTFRVSLALKAKLLQYGDAWARRALEKAKPPKEGE